MKELEFNNEMIRRATEWAENLGGIYNSITSGDGNFAGRLGELAFANYIGEEVKDNKDFDVVHNGEKLEVKTKRRAVAPLPYYEGSVAMTSEHQRPDRYVFMSLQFEKSGRHAQPADGLKRRGGKWYKNLQKVWYCGDMDAREFFRTSVIWKRGDKDSSNGFKTLVDMYNIPHDKLDVSF